uniref:Large ribosomal subunit protein uL3c n=1 Tax=Spumella sp. NIES-1846 TaxID=2490549 RepID=A0A455RFY4_9STRA|nr:ribosomal protein L3 [Spumella sp. NIES-1846]
MIRLDTVGLFAYKENMSQIYTKAGKLVPTTYLKLGICYLTEFKTILTHKYNAIKISLKNKFHKILKQKEFSVKNINKFTLYQVFTILDLRNSNIVTVQSFSKGKGYTGNIKRHNFNRGPMSHGSKHHRLQGSLGAGTTPGRVFPGKRMSGQMGFTKITHKNLKILELDNIKNRIYLHGNVAGTLNTLVLIKYNI